MTTAVIVGGGPNGLSAALYLAQEGVDVTILEANSNIGGGARSGEETLPGLIHDHCSAFHPLGAASSFWREMNLEEFGLKWLWPEIDCAHPLDSGQVALLHHSLDKTISGLGEDGQVWEKIIGPNVRNFDALAEDIFSPIIHFPRDPLSLLKFSQYASLPASAVSRLFKTEQGKALFCGIAAHSFANLHRPLTASLGIVISAAGHKWGWPVAQGGSGSITTALVKALAKKNVKIHLNYTVKSKEDIPHADIVLLNLSPRQVVTLYGDEMPTSIKRSYLKYRLGASAFKVDYAIDGHIPWRNSECAKAGTVHIGGSVKEMIRSESLRAKGKMVPNPFVLLGQQYLPDPSRSDGKNNPIYAYAHVPRGYSGDATTIVTNQIERFAPGFRDRIIQAKPTNPNNLYMTNSNFENGDIIGGSADGFQLIFRPRVTPNPYHTGVKGVYICSHFTPPGAGVHGICGKNAAEIALKNYERLK